MNYMMNGMSSEESDEKKLFFCTQFFFWGKVINIGIPNLYTILPMNL